MSARIGILDDGIYKSVYLFNTNDVLKLSVNIKQNYKKKDHVVTLINNGDISSLCKNLEKSRFFFRDKGDPWEACVPYDEKAEMLNNIDINSSPVDYYFVFFENKWYVSKSYNENDWTTLTKFINVLKKK